MLTPALHRLGLMMIARGPSFKFAKTEAAHRNRRPRPRPQSAAAVSGRGSAEYRSTPSESRLPPVDTPARPAGGQGMQPDACRRRRSGCRAGNAAAAGSHGPACRRWPLRLVTMSATHVPLLPPTPPLSPAFHFLPSDQKDGSIFPAASSTFKRSREVTGDHGRSCKVTCGHGEVTLKSRCSCGFKSLKLPNPRGAQYGQICPSRGGGSALFGQPGPTVTNLCQHLTTCQHFGFQWLATRFGDSTRFGIAWPTLPSLSSSIPPSVPPSHSPSSLSH